MLAHAARKPERWCPLHSGRTSQNYYVSRPTLQAAETEAFADYWRPKPDPDGQIRERCREQYLSDVAEELRYLERLQSRPDSRARILDVGHGLGWLLSGLGDRWDKFGTEVCREAHEHAKREHGIKSFFGKLHEAKYEDESFDAVTCHHVIEHLPDPLDTMHQIRRVLKGGGALILATPDFTCPCAKRFGANYRMLHDKTHVSLFSLESATRMLCDLGFKIKDVAFPFPDRYATAATMERWKDASKVSPPWPGNWMTFYCEK